MKAFAPAWAVLGLLAAGTPAAAQVAVPSLYNTGVGVSGGLLPEGSSDPHYQWVGLPGGGGQFSFPAHVAVSTESPLSGGAWLTNGPTSQWLVPWSSAGANQHGGDF